MAADELEEGPDANEIRRHAKKMLTVREYNLKYRRLDFYKPHAGQLRFHNSRATEVQLLAGNQQGKSWSAAGQTSLSTPRYSVRASSGDIAHLNSRRRSGAGLCGPCPRRVPPAA